MRTSITREILVVSKVRTSIFPKLKFWKMQIILLTWLWIIYFRYLGWLRGKLLKLLGLLILLLQKFFYCDIDTIFGNSMISKSNFEHFLTVHPF